MKRNKLVLAAFLAAVLSFGVSPANALQQSQIVALKKAVTEMPNLELGPKASDLVLKASTKDREEIATLIVRTVVTKKPTMVIVLVESIAKAAPETAPAVAAVAAELCPGRAAEIAKVATAAAPDQARHIAASVAQRAPKSAREITRSVVASAPSESPEIIESVLAAVPAAKAQVNSDLTLNIISTLARNSRASAATFGTSRFGSRPLKPFGTPAPTAAPTPTVSAPRSSAVENAIKTLTAPPADSKIDVKLQSEITIAMVTTLNAIGREPDVSSTEKASIINTTMASITTILAPGATGSTQSTISAADKTDIVKTMAKIVTTIISDPGLADSVKLNYVNFSTTSIKAIVANPTVRTGTIDNAVAGAAGEVEKVIAAVQNQTPEQAQAGLTTAATAIDQAIKPYASP